MRNIIYTSFFLLLAASCSDAPQIPDEKEVQNELKKQREFVVGNFRDLKVKDTVFVELVDEKTLKYVPAKLDADWQTNLDLLVKRDTRLQLTSGNQSLLISGYEQVVGTSLLENLGDLNGDKLDEIGFVWHAEDYSLLNTYYIYSFSNGKLTETLHFGICDENLLDGKPLMKKLGKGNILCREYDPDGIAPEYVEKKLP